MSGPKARSYLKFGHSLLDIGHSEALCGIHLSAGAFRALNRRRRG